MKISNSGCNIFLPDHLIDSENFSETPYVQFEINPFLDDFTYENLAREIASLEDFDFVFDGLGEKKKRSVNLENLDSVKEGCFKDFCTIILGAQFYSWFKSTHLSYFERTFFNFQISGPNKFRFKVIRRFLKYIPVPLGLYYTEVEYSSLGKGAFIPPHTDAKNKRLSFVLYLPIDNNLSNEERIQLGTVFWKARATAQAPLRRFDCILLEGEEKERFYEEHEIHRVSSYEANKVAGFIKSDNSWHSVEKNNLDYDRRAIVINVWRL